MRVAKALTLLFAAIPLAGCATHRTTPDRIVDRVIAPYHRAGKFSGAVLVGLGDEVVYQAAFGLADETWRVANTPETRFRIGSLTKQFTGALILELSRHGRLDLNRTLSVYLPAYRADVGGAITIRQLLSHSAGVPDFVRRPDVMEILKRPASPDEVVSNLCSGALEFKPGTRFQYSNFGYPILGAVYEKVSGES
jgi:CubicO group peptidase (beta-lactamase class C family)